MGHLTTRDMYRDLGDRISWFTQRVPASGALYKVLQVLYSKKGAEWVALLLVRPSAIKKTARIWDTSKHRAEKLLGHLCDKALLVDSRDKGVRKFVMPPPMAGFIGFALIRIRRDIDQKYLSELYYQYMNVKEDFIEGLFYATETKLGRVFVQEPVLTNDRMNHILDYERTTHIVEEAEYIGLGLCYCRHKVFHMGHPCETNAPWDMCLTFDNVACSLIQHGDYYKLISKEETADTLECSYASSPVQTGKNVREHPASICNCCGCCCKVLQAARRFSPMQPVTTANYIPDISGDQCTGRGECAEICPVSVISMEDGGDGKKRTAVDRDVCLGCGACARNCGVKAIHMERGPEQIIAPVNNTHRFALQTIEKGTLTNPVFGNQAFSNHRTVAALFSIILEPPPLKQAMASRQFEFAYLDRLLAAKQEKG